MPRRKKVEPLKKISLTAAAILIRAAAERVTDPAQRATFKGGFADRLPTGVREALVTTLARKFGPHAIFPVFDILVVGSARRQTGGQLMPTGNGLKRLKFYEAGFVDDKFWLDDVMMLYRLMER
jgi:hypothetical protein